MLERMMERETYRDCMRNHAATLGTYATDGCGEYTPDPTSPAGMQCAACGCHRNFHRKVHLESSTDNANTIGGFSPPACEERATSDGGKRRVRTKFSAEQKERMLRFSEKIGWRIPRRDGDVDEVGEFCREIGVSRQIFKVWMHNHKSNGGGGGSSSSPSSASAAVAAAAAIVAAANADNNNTNARVSSSLTR